MLNNWIEIFRAGDYGAKGSYGERDLDSIVANYEPSSNEAPIVLGHPDSNAPAYGRVESLKRSGKTLLAKFRQVSPQLEDHVRTGRFKKRSAAFYQKPDGSLSLRHVGFLGAQAPQVKGLAAVAVFSENAFTAIEFSIEAPMNTDAATKALQAIDTLKQRGQWRDDYEQRGLPAIFLEAAKNSAIIQFADGRKQPMLQALADVVARVTPRIVNGMIVDQDSVELAEAAQRRAAIKSISFGEALTQERHERQAHTNPGGIEVDPRSVRKDSIVRELMSADATLTYGEALQQVNHIEFDDMPDGPIRPALVQKADQVSQDNNIPFAKALLQVLDDAGFPWQKDKTLADLNESYGTGAARIERQPGQKQSTPNN
jgi:hypothetical protein